MAPRVFISHSSADEQAAKAVCDALEAGGTPCWIAPRDISAGTEWGEAVVDGLVGSRIMVLMLSEAANNSPHVKREMQRAFERGLQVVPVRLEPVTPSRTMEYYISPVQWLNAYPPPLSVHLPRIVAAVRSLLDAPPAAASLTTGLSGSNAIPPTPATGRGLHFRIGSPKVGCAVSVITCLMIASGIHFLGRNGDGGGGKRTGSTPTNQSQPGPLDRPSGAGPSYPVPPQPGTTPSTRTTVTTQP